MRLARTKLSAISIATIAALLAGCGGGGGSSSLPASPTPSKSQSVKASLKFHFNAKRSSALRGRKYTSRATKGLSISFGADGVVNFPNNLAGLQASQGALGSPTTTFVSAISSGLVSSNITCSTAAADGSFDCTVLLPVQVGYQDFQITTWDQAPKTLGPNSDGFGGTFDSTANDLATNVLYSNRVDGNSTNAFNFTLNGVVASVALSVNPGTLVSGQGALTAMLTVIALDADGNTIIGSDPYVDADGNALTITVSKKSEDDPAGAALTGPAAPAGGNVTIAGQTAFADPSVQSTTVAFNGYETNNAVFQASLNSALTIASNTPTLGFTNTTVSGGSGSSLGAAGSPVMNALAVTGLNTAYSIAGSAYNDSHLYVGDFGNNKIVQINGGTTPTAGTSWTIPTASANVNGVIIAPDQQVWFAEQSTGKVGAVDPATGHFTELALTSGAAPSRSAIGPDSNVWFTEQGLDGVAKVVLSQGNTPAAVTEYKNIVTAGGQPIGITSDGTNLWVSEVGAPKIAKISTAGALLKEYTLSPVPGFNNAMTLRALVVGADGNLWIADQNNNAIYQVSAANGTILNAYRTAGTPLNMLAAKDGTVYFTERNTNHIGRLTPAGLLSEYTNGLSAPNFGSSVWSLAQGFDGQIYFTQSGGTNVGYFAP